MLESLHPRGSHASAAHPPFPAVLLVETKDTWGELGLAIVTDFFSHSDVMWRVVIKAKRKALIFLVAFNQHYTMALCNKDGLGPARNQRTKRSQEKKCGQGEEVRSRSIFLPVYFLRGSMVTSAEQTFANTNGSKRRFEAAKIIWEQWKSIGFSLLDQMTVSNSYWNRSAQLQQAVEDV